MASEGRGHCSKGSCGPQAPAQSPLGRSGIMCSHSLHSVTDRGREREREGEREKGREGGVERDRESGHRYKSVREF